MTAEVLRARTIFYLWGHCHALATAIREITGWPRVFAWDGPSDAVPQHFYVQTPDGYYLDIRGEHEPEGIRDYWEHVQLEEESIYWSLRGLILEGHYRPLTKENMEMARSEARWLLQHHNLYP